MNRYKIIQIFVTFLIISFLVFWVISVIFGGEAVNGKIEDGRYYFGSHGKYTEVSRAAYVASAGYVMIMEVIVGIGMLLIFFCFFVKEGISIKDLKEEGIFSIFFIFPLLIGCGFLYGSFQSLKCILRAFGII
jgi:hypothetical protein